METGGQIKEEEKTVAGEKVEATICSFPDIRGGPVGIMEARKPDRQGRPASVLASSLPRFISYCHVAAWPGLLTSVCVFVHPVRVCRDVGRTREDGWRPYRPVEATCSV